MTDEELEIEKLAQDFILNQSREKETILLNALQKAKFVKIIVTKCSKDFKEKISIEDFLDYKLSVVYETLDGIKRNYNPAKGNKFINYFSRCLKDNCKNFFNKELKDIDRIESLDDSSDNEEDSTSETRKDQLTDSRYNENEFERQLEYKESIKNLKKIYKIIEKIYNFSAHGQKNKSLTYTFCVLESLLSIKEQDCIDFINEFSFLQPQRTLIMNYYNDYSKGLINLPSQKEYASVTGIAETKLSEMRGALRDEMKLLL